MTQDAEQVDTTAAQAYEQFMLPRTFGPWIEATVALADLQPGEQVLDVACGSGMATRLAAERVGATGRAVGLDLDPGMIAVARAHASTPHSAPLEWRCESALKMSFEDDFFDRVFCFHGLQFFPDRVAGLAEMRRVMKPTGRFLATVWRSIDYCAGPHALATALTRRGIDASAAHRPYALGDADELQGLLRQAGFQQIEVQAKSIDVHFPSARNFIESLAAGAPSTRLALAQVSPDDQAGLIEEVSDLLEPHITEEGLSYPTECYLLMGHF
ncbi:MAG TPA: methyltransferase domain-containing protein [Afifellaceae bacterium]|nr:methyltransferase domain-containing protein [Afifellaceae bacterium]